MQFLSEWYHPSNQYRMKPFWFWNGELTYEEIEYQLQQLKQQGLAGAFICPRQGQRVPYLGKGWFERVLYAVNKAEKYGLELWIYDEYPYPSGMGGGEVLLQNPSAAHTKLKHDSFLVDGEQVCEISLGWSVILYASAVKIKEGNEPLWDSVVDLRDCVGIRQEQEIFQQSGMTAYADKRFFTYQPEHIIRFTLPKGKWKLEVFKQETLDDYKYYGNFFDPCDKAAVSTFLNVTHEQYYSLFKNNLRNKIKGFFSDEVSFLGEIPWSKHLPDYLMEHYNYNVLEALPALFHKDYPQAAKIRYQLYQSAHKLLQESYHLQVSNWCKEHECLFATELPSVRRSTQIYSDIPGGDACHEKLGVKLEEVYDRYLLNYRSCVPGIASLARQKNCKYAMVESFHSIGWSMTLQDAKWMIDWMVAMGINFFTLHAFYYTIDSITKYDAPPSQFIQNPYWPYYHNLADYAARLSAFISNTEAVCKVALLDPVTSLWTRLGNPRKGFAYAGNDDAECKELSQLTTDWIYLAKTMLFHHIQFDFLDSEILADSRIEEGQICIGRARYHVLILPPMTSIEGFATTKIRQFIKAGGKVIATGVLPYEIIDEDNDVEQTFCKLFGTKDSNRKQYWMSNDAMRVDLIRSKNTYFFSTKGSICHETFKRMYLELLRKESLNDVEISVAKSSSKEIISSFRTDCDHNRYLFVGNHGMQMVQVNIKLQNTFTIAQEMNARTGEITPLYKGNKRKKLKISLARYEAKLILFDSDECQEKSIDEDTEILTIDISKPMEVSIKGDNVLRIDKFQVSRDKINWIKAKPKTFIELCSAFHWLSGNDIILQGKFGTPRHMSIRYPFQLYYKSEFYVKEMIRPLFLMKDKRTISSYYEIYINDKMIPMSDFQHIFLNDSNNEMCDISKLVKPGCNSIQIMTIIEHDWDGIRDPIYILGRFGIETGEIGKMPEKALLRDTFIEGFPWYSGIFTFKTEYVLQKVPTGENVRLIPQLPENTVDCVELIINKTSLGVKVFSPYEWVCPSGLLKSKNQVEIKIANTLEPMLEGSYFDYSTHKTTVVDYEQD